MRSSRFDVGGEAGDIRPGNGGVIDGRPEPIEDILLFAE